MKPTQAILRQRLDEVYAIRVDGATIHDVRRYVAEKEAAGEQPWTIPDGGRPVSERTLWRYIQQTDRMMDEVSRESRKRMRRRHLAQRRNLYAKALAQGDIKAALSVLRDEAELLNLYPARKTQVTGKDGGPVVLHVTEEIIGGQKGPAALENIVEEIVTHDSTTDNRPADDPPPSGAASVPQI
jgi:hypothetical protein